MTFNSFKREGTLENGIKFQGQERVTDLNLNWDAFRYRNYMPEIGRFFNIDPLSDKYVYNSPYAFAENKLGLGIELEGLELLPFSLMSRAGWMTRVTRSMEKHHLIPRQHKLDKVVQQARKDGFKLEGKENKTQIEKFNKGTGEGRHGNHPNYNEHVGKKLSEFAEKNPNPGPGEAGNFVKDLAKGLSEAIKNNPEAKINDLFKPNGTAATVPSQAESDVSQSSEPSPEQKFEMKEGLINQEQIRQGLENFYKGMQEAEEKMLNDPI